MITNEQLKAWRELCEKDFDCSDSSCRFARSRGGMRTNGGCRCIDRSAHATPGLIPVLAASRRALPALLDEVERLRGVSDAERAVLEAARKFAWAQRQTHAEMPSGVLAGAEAVLCNAARKLGEENNQ